MFPDYSRILLQPLKTPWLSSAKVEAAMLRLDLLHPEVSGNKWYKLKYNIEAAVQQQKDAILTFGGVRSNHIAATAAAAPKFGLKSIGIIRGELSQKDNPSLKRAAQHGMQLQFIGRSDYKKRYEKDFLQSLQQKFPNAYIVPEGGNNNLGIKGATEIMNLVNKSDYSHICCPVGTGSTLAGILSKTTPNQKVLGFCALKKADEQRAVVTKYLQTISDYGNWDILTDYCFGGFAKRSKIVDECMQSFNKVHDIPLDFIYNAKMLLGIKDLCKKHFFPKDSNLLLVHTGGLQGNEVTFSPQTYK